jgi:hypothetical protein
MVSRSPVGIVSSYQREWVDKLVDLTGAVLIDADLRNADLSRTVLSFANLTGAILRGANFTGADLSDVDCSRANVFGGLDTSGAIFCRTVMPDGTLRNDHCGPANAPTDSGEVPVGGTQPGGTTADASGLPIGGGTAAVGIIADPNGISPGGETGSGGSRRMRVASRSEAEHNRNPADPSDASGGDGYVLARP